VDLDQDLDPEDRSRVNQAEALTEFQSGAYVRFLIIILA
jgi:hypothetical protein